MQRSEMVRFGLPLALAGVLGGCAALRQNMRGQELSYRGAWYCEAPNCKVDEMVQSRSGTRDGEVSINTVKLAPQAAMMFTAAAPFDALTAKVRDCKGNTADVPSREIVGGGKHEVGDAEARESWVVWINPSSLPGLKRAKGCTWKVEATATWSDGATYSLTAGVDFAK